MPSPNPQRDSFLRYLREDFPLGEDWNGGGWAAPCTKEQVREAIFRIKGGSPQLHGILWAFCYSGMSRGDIAERMGYESSTIKRKLDKACNIVLAYLVPGFDGKTIQPRDGTYDRR